MFCIKRHKMKHLVSSARGKGSSDHALNPVGHWIILVLNLCKMLLFLSPKSIDSHGICSCLCTFFISLVVSKTFRGLYFLLNPKVKDIINNKLFALFVLIIMWNQGFKLATSSGGAIFSLGSKRILWALTSFFLFCPALRYSTSPSQTNHSKASLATFLTYQWLEECQMIDRSTMSGEQVGLTTARQGQTRRGNVL